MVVSISQAHNVVSCGPIDVCKTPAPPAPAPVPLPYPNVAISATPGSGYTTKTLIAGTPACTKKSKIALSNGDQPGVALNVVSSKIMGQAAATSASSDVFAEGGEIVRTLDSGESNLGGQAGVSCATFVLAPGVAIAIGVSDIEAYWICKLHCQVQQEYNHNEIKGRGCMSARFAKLLGEAKKSVPGLADLHAEQSFGMCEGVATLLTPTAFVNAAMTVAAAGGTALNYIKAAGTGSGASWTPGQIAAVGLSVGAIAALRLGKALGALGLGSVCRPDIISTAGGNTVVLDNKFTWKNGVKDKLSDAQRANYPKCDSSGRLRPPIDSALCGCT